MSFFDSHRGLFFCLNSPFLIFFPLPSFFFPLSSFFFPLSFSLRLFIFFPTNDIGWYFPPQGWRVFSNIYTPAYSIVLERDWTCSEYVLTWLLTTRAVKRRLRNSAVPVGQMEPETTRYWSVQSPLVGASSSVSTKSTRTCTGYSVRVLVHTLYWFIGICTLCSFVRSIWEN